MPETLSITISIIAIAISAVTAYLTLFRRGTVRMTLPTVIYFGPDGRSPQGRKSSAKVFFRTLLYATSKRGRIVESMFVRLRRGESSQNFSIWVYGNDSLSRGSGIFVGENGVAWNHHFLLPADGTAYEFTPGEYLIEIFATLVGSRHSLKLHEVRLLLDAHIAEQLKNSENGLYFDWGPDSGRYHPHVRQCPKDDFPPFLQKLMAEGDVS